MIIDHNNHDATTTSNNSVWLKLFKPYVRMKYSQKCNNSKCTYNESLNILILHYYYLIGKNVCLLLYKCIQQNLFWKHQCQRETPKEDKI